MAKFSKEHREKLSAARVKAWARLSPEERQAAIEKSENAWKRAKQIGLMSRGALPQHFPVPNFIDPDFDEGL